MCKLNIDINKYKNELLNKIGNSWKVLEGDYLPFSFVSNKGAFLFKLLEDDESLIDTWCLVIPGNEKIFKKFIEGKLSYKEFFEKANCNFYLIGWDINNLQLKIKDKIDLQNILKLTKDIHNEKLLLNKEVIEMIINNITKEKEKEKWINMILDTCCLKDDEEIKNLLKNLSKDELIKLYSIASFDRFDGISILYSMCSENKNLEEAIKSSNLIEAYDSIEELIDDYIEGDEEILNKYSDYNKFFEFLVNEGYTKEWKGYYLLFK